MKFVSLVFLASSPFLSTNVLVQAECDEVKDEPTCKSGRTACSTNSECCEGLGCFGFSFYKHCQEAPACLDEWMDCSGGTDCCPGLVCSLMSNGAEECQEKTVRTVVIDNKGSIKSTTPPTSAPTAPPPDEVNKKTTRIPGEPVNYVVACSVGDPHLYTFDGLNHDCQGEVSRCVSIVCPLWFSPCLQPRLDLFCLFCSLYRANSLWSRAPSLGVIFKPGTLTSLTSMQTGTSGTTLSFPSRKEWQFKMREIHRRSR